MKLFKRISPGVLLTLAFFATLFFTYPVAFAKLGVGMGAGEVRLTETVKPGGIYALPSLRVFNTGDETAGFKDKSVPAKDGSLLIRTLLSLKPDKAKKSQ